MTRLILVVVLCFAGFSSAQAETTEFVAAVRLPNIEVDGATIKIHTQGLYVTGDDFLVTGRVDTPPRRPVLLRFPRDDIQKYELLDLTVPGKETISLNHPGGFDRDSDGVLWIPVSTSDRRGPTTVMGVPWINRKLPADVTEITKTFVVADHLGAICCLDGGRLLAANWDTHTVYLIDSSSGSVLEKIEHDDFFGGAAGFHLAVQDWKFDLESKLVIAAGIDKSADRDLKLPRAVIAWIDPKTRNVATSIRLQRSEDVARSLTKEGMAWYDGQLYLLPEDLGRGAKILRYSIVP